MQLKILNESNINIADEMMLLDEANAFGVQEKGFLTTIKDYLANLVGIAPINISSLDTNAELNQRLSGLFNNIDVQVRIYNSKQPGAYCIPGLRNNEYSVAFANIFQFLGSSIITKVLGIHLLYKIANALCNMVGAFMNLSQWSSGQLILDPTTKKFSIDNVNNILIFMSDSMFEMYDEDEIIAICLHEIGHYTMAERIAWNMLLKALVTALGIPILQMLVAYFLHDVFTPLNMQDKDDNSSFATGNIFQRQGIKEGAKILYDYRIQTPFVKGYEEFSKKVPKLNSKFLVYVILFIFFSYLSAYSKRKQEIYADEFAIKVGYGKAFLSAIQKLHLHSCSFDPLVQSGIKMNILDRILRFFKAIIERTYNAIIKTIKLGDYPDYKTRERLIQKKIEAYDTSDKNLDRSEHIKLKPTLGNIIDNF